MVLGWENNFGLLVDSSLSKVAANGQGGVCLGSARGMLGP